MPTVFTRVYVDLPFSRSEVGFFIISSQRSKIQTDRNFPKSLSLISDNVLKTPGIKRTAEQNITVRYEVYKRLFISPLFEHTRALRFTGEVFYHIL